MDIKDRIKKYLEIKSITKYQFYKKIGLSNGFLDKPGTIGCDKCEKIYYQFPDINIIWLLTGRGNMLKEDQVTEPMVSESTATYGDKKEAPVAKHTDRKSVV